MFRCSRMGAPWSDIASRCPYWSVWAGRQKDAERGVMDAVNALVAENIVSEASGVLRLYAAALRTSWLPSRTLS